jgi:putative methanogenesis marker protein 6
MSPKENHKDPQGSDQKTADQEVDDQMSDNNMNDNQLSDYQATCDLKEHDMDSSDSATINQDDVITRMIILSPNANISQSEVVQKLHMMELPLTIKSTCYGAMVHGKKEIVMDAINKIRILDPYNIFTKDRGFPPGDPRRCRGHRGAAREGYHQLEKEFKLLGYVGEALKKPRKVSIEKPEKVSVDTFQEIIKEDSNKKSLDKSKTKDEA